MSKKSESNSLTANRNKLVPRLRFPEFKNSEEWERYPLEKFLIKNTKKNRDGKYTLIQSISNKHGFINQEDYFDNRFVASKNISNYYIIERGTFAYNPSRIDVGSLAYKFDDKTSIISPLYISFKSNPQFLEDLFLLFWFDTIEFYKQMKVLLEGGVRNILSFENLAKIKISYPTTLSEQQKIADCLSSIDDVITAETQKLEALKQHKKGLLQNLFPREGEKVPRLRFPEFKDSGEWEEKKLGEIADFLKGKGISKKDIDDKGNQPCIRYGELYTHYGEIISEIKSFTNLPSKNLMLSKENDVILPASGETKEDIAAASCLKIKNVALGGDINILRSKIINGEFLAYFLRHIVRKNIGKIAQGNAIVHLYSNQLKQLTIKMPSKKEEQEKIASTLYLVDELLNVQINKIETLKLHKKGLLQGLFPEVN